ncbi:MAG: dienelactone hydrolase family protein [Acidobacteria bacterium]|nr:dienelactone hydrolase family protein [Acidobacteriota bacterium]
MSSRLRDAILVALSMVVLAWPSPSVAADKPTKETLNFEGQSRTYYLFVPANPSKKPAPLIVLLHGSGRDGRSLLDKWQSLAEKEGIVVAGPESKDRQFWAPDTDGPAFLHDVIEAIKQKHAVDPKRVYLFGHSAGAIQALSMAVLESEYLAAVAAHAGVLQKELEPYLRLAERKIPIGIWVGTSDPLFPVKVVRATRDIIAESGFAVELIEIKNHTHAYYDRADEINKGVWAFLRQHALTADPVYKSYVIAR